MRQVQKLIELARERGLSPRAPERAEQRGGMVILAVPHGEAVARELVRREILVDYRPGAGIRLSPHFYTSDEELSYAVDQIAQILASGAHRSKEVAVETQF
jgi:kynureninase